MRKRESHIFEREDRDFYVEPSWVSERLFEEMYFGNAIHDPACGWGTITTAAAKAGYDVSGADLVDRRRHKLGKNFKREDFLKRKRALNRSVVCNPPFALAEEFARHALKLGAPDVALIMMVRRLNAAHWMRELPLLKVLLLTPRPSMPPGAWLAAGNKPGGGTQDFCWVIFGAGYQGMVEMDWLQKKPMVTVGDKVIRREKRSRDMARSALRA